MRVNQDTTEAAPRAPNLGSGPGLDYRGGAAGSARTVFELSRRRIVAIAAAGPDVVVLAGDNSMWRLRQGEATWQRLPDVPED